MDLDTYEEWAQEECDFIGQLLEEDGVQNVMLLCLALGKDSLNSFASEHSREVQEFFHTPRDERHRFLEPLGEPANRTMFLVCALHEARCALTLLQSLCKFGVSGSSGTARSRILVQTAAAFHEAASHKPSLYPFAEDQPFGMDQRWFSPHDA